MAFEHGVRILEQPTSLVAPVLGTAGLQVVFGTAPVNLADDPYNVTNKPIIAYRWAEAVSQLGYSEEQDSLGHYRYTLCASMYASFQLVGVAPVVFVNVLDPTKHKKKNDPAEVPVVDLEATVPITGILLDTVAVKFSDSEGTQVELKEKEDYILTFDDDGHLQITLVSSGAGAAAAKLTVDSTSIDPTALDSDDVIGVSAAGGERGMEVVRQVYPKLGMTPGLLLAPGWSHIPDAGIVLAAKCQEINGYFNCEGFIDIDSTESGCTRYSDVKTAKEAAGCTNKRIMALWPCIQVGSRKFWYSAIMGAVTAYVDATNDDVPSLSPSNKLIGVTGTVLADGETEVVLDQLQGTVRQQGLEKADLLSGGKGVAEIFRMGPGDNDAVGIKDVNLVHLHAGGDFLHLLHAVLEFRLKFQDVGNHSSVVQTLRRVLLPHLLQLVGVFYQNLLHLVKDMLGGIPVGLACADHLGRGGEHQDNSHHQQRDSAHIFDHGIFDR